MYLYTEYRGVPEGMYMEYRDCISLYLEYKLSMSCDTESPDDDLYDVTTTIHIHTQSHFRLYSSRRTNYPGRVGKLALHNRNQTGGQFMMDGTAIPTFWQAISHHQSTQAKMEVNP